MADVEHAQIATAGLDGVVGLVADELLGPHRFGAAGTADAPRSEESDGRGKRRVIDDDEFGVRAE